MLCTVAQIKTRLGETSSEHDALLLDIVGKATALIEAYCSRTLIVTAADVTETYTGRGPFLQVDRYPIVSVTSIKEAWDYDFANVDALIVNTSYRLIAGGRKGIIKRLCADWLDIDDAVQVVYRGGYTAAGETPGPGEIALPEDLVEAAIEQSLFLYQRKGRDIGTSGHKFEGGGFDVVENSELLKSVARILDRSYKRWAA